MIFWSIYIFSSFIISFFVSKSLPSKVRIGSLVIVFILLVTPATIESQENTLAPALFIFFYDVLFEKFISFRSLRPLLLTIPLSGIILLTFIFIKRKFF